MNMIVLYVMVWRFVKRNVWLSWWKFDRSNKRLSHNAAAFLFNRHPLDIQHLSRSEGFMEFEADLSALFCINEMHLYIHL